MARTPRKRPSYSPKKAPRQARSRVTYESILDAAARLLATTGYEALTTNHVAELAGVAIGSLYEYFPDRETIVAEVARRTLRELAIELADGLDSTLSLERSAGLEAAMHSWVTLLFRSVEKRGGLLSTLGRAVPFVRDLEEVRELPVALLAIARRARPLIKNDLMRAAPEAWTYIVTIMVTNTVLESVIARPPHLSREDVREALVRMLVFLIEGRHGPDHDR